MSKIEVIAEIGSGLLMDYDLPEGWEDQVWAWLRYNNVQAIQSGHPTESDLVEAFEDLGFPKESDNE